MSKLYFSICLLVYLFICALFLPSSVSAKYSSDVTVSALIGGGTIFSLYGYTSPEATVTMSSQGIYNETRSDNTGYFLFKNQPTSLYNQEICLSALDMLGRVSTPICVPPVPFEDNINIGPVILPPTVSLNNGALFIGEEPVLSGQTIPNTQVKLSLFTDENKNTPFLTFKALVSPVEAYTIPKIDISSDSKGNYSIALSSAQAQNYRLFTQSYYQQSLSPKSNTLRLGIMPIWIYLIQLMSFLWRSFKRYLFDFIIVSQIVSIGIYILNKYLHPFHLYHIYHKTKYPLALRPNQALVVEKIPLMVIEE